MAQRSFDTGFNQFTDVVNKVADAKKQSAINALVANQDTTDPYRAQSELFGSLTQIDGVNATEALGLSNAVVMPAIAKQAKDRAEFVSDRDFGSKTVAGGTGQVWGMDPETGKYNIKIGDPKPVDGSKFLTTRDVKYTDPVDGTESVRTYSIDKRNPNVDLVTGLNIPTQVKYQQVSQQDKDRYDSLRGTMFLLKQTPGQEGVPFDPGTVGNADRFSAWLDNVSGFGWSDDTEQTIINSGRWNILGGQLVKQMYGGNASDADRDSVFQYVPQSGDSEKVYKAKSKEFSKLMANNYSTFKDRMDRSNPGYVATEKTNAAPTQSESGPTLNGRPVIFTD